MKRKRHLFFSGLIPVLAFVFPACRPSAPVRLEERRAVKPIKASDLERRIGKFPMVSLAHLPTPLELMPSLSRALGGPKIYIKRDDQTGLAFGGNKARKLEFIMADVIKKGADAVITAGGVQSNWCRSTAAAACRLGRSSRSCLHGKSHGRSLRSSPERVLSTK